MRGGDKGEKRKREGRWEVCGGALGIAQRGDESGGGEDGERGAMGLVLGETESGEEGRENNAAAGTDEGAEGGGEETEEEGGEVRLGFLGWRGGGVEGELGCEVESTEIGEGVERREEGEVKMQRLANADRDEGGLEEEE